MATALEIIGVSAVAAAVVGLLMIGLGKLATRERHSESDTTPEVVIRARTWEERTQALAALAPFDPVEEDWKATMHLFAEIRAEDIQHFHQRTIKLLTDFLGEPYVIADSFDQLHEMFDGTPTESFAKVE